MPIWLLKFCRWLQNSPVGLAVGGTAWGYPYVQLIHFFGLSSWVGTIVIVDLRLIGIARGPQTAGQLADQLLTLTWTGLGIAITGGFLLFSANATTYIHNAAFQTKLPLILLGIVYHAVMQCKVRKWSESPSTPPLAKLAGIAELALWLGVITAAVEIPNY